MSVASHDKTRSSMSNVHLAVANRQLPTLIANVQMSSGTVTPMNLDPLVREMLLELSVAEAADAGDASAAGDVRPPRPLALSTLSQQAQLVIDSQGVSDGVREVRARAVSLISDLLNKKYSGKYTAVVFGSTAWDIDNNTSDVDVSIVQTRNLAPLKFADAKRVINQFCREIKDSLRNSHELFVYNVLSHTRVPVSTMYYYHNNTRVQLQVSSTTDHVNVKLHLISRLLRDYPVAVQLFKAIKVWAKARCLINSRKRLLNSFSLFLLVIQYLQLRVKNPLGVIQPAPFAYAHTNAASSSDIPKFELVDLASPATEEAAAAAVAKLPHYLIVWDSAANAMQRIESGSPAVRRAIAAVTKTSKSYSLLLAADARVDKSGGNYDEAHVDDVDDDDENEYEDEYDDECEDKYKDESESKAEVDDGVAPTPSPQADDKLVSYSSLVRSYDSLASVPSPAASPPASVAAALMPAAQSPNYTKSNCYGHSIAQTVREHLEKNRVFFGPIVGGARAIVSHSNGHLFDAQPAEYKLDILDAPRRAPESIAVARAMESSETAAQLGDDQEDDGSLGALVKGFFAFYATAFDPAVHAVSIRQGHLVWRQPLLDRTLGYSQACVPIYRENSQTWTLEGTMRSQFKGVDWRSAELVIEDPLSAVDSSARSLHAHRSKTIWTELRRAHALLSGSSASYETVVCEPLSKSLTRLHQVVRKCAGADAVYDAHHDDHKPGGDSTPYTATSALYELQLSGFLRHMCAFSAAIVKKQREVKVPVTHRDLVALRAQEDFKRQQREQRLNARRM